LDPSKYAVEVIVAFLKKNPDDDPRIETRVGVHFTIKTLQKSGFTCALVGVK
jgi:hypothetical protein